MDDLRTIPPQQDRETVSGELLTLPGEREKRENGVIGPGTVLLQRYKIISELGQGGMGVVYKCFDEIAGIEVALKALPPELSHNTLEMEDIKENFQLVSKLVHQNIAVNRTLEKDSESGNYFLVMECVEGEDLRRWIKRKQQNGSLTLEDILPVISQIAAALDYAHEQKVMHRDIKPGNIMINQQGVIKVLDFGLAARIYTSMSRISMAFRGTSGTGPYMAPEQWRGMVQGAAADQYALGVMTYEFLAGHLPFESSDLAVLKQAVLDEKVQPIPGLPKYVRAALEKAMSKKAEKRFAKCADFVAALSSGKKKSGKKGPEKWIVGVVALVIVLAAGIWGAGRFFKQQEEKRHLEILELEQSGKIGALSEKVRQEKELRKSMLKYQTRYGELETLLTAVRKINFAPGQAFETRRKELEEFSAAAKAAADEKNFSEVWQCLDKAESAARWIKKNLSLCEKAAQLAASGTEMKKSAEPFEPAKRVPAVWKNALSYTAAAQKQYDSGDFKSAVQNFEKAASEYRNAGTQARKNHLEELIRQARSAVIKQDWDKVTELSKKILPLDKSIAEGFLRSADNGKSVKGLIAEWEKALKKGKIEEALRLQESVAGRAKMNPRILKLRETLLALCKVENEKLQDSVAFSKKQIGNAACSREQGFGKYLDTLEKSYSAGVAKKSSDPIAAFKLLKEADAAAVWIQENAPLRLQAERRLERVGEVKADADKFYSGVEAVEEYSEASSFYAQGKVKYDSGEFTAAIELFNKAVTGYENVRKKVMAYYEKDLLRAAADAVGRRSWEELKKIAEELYAVDGSKAKKLSEQADNGLKIEKWFAEAEKNAAQGEFGRALDRLNSILKLDENHKEALLFKGKIEEKQRVGVTIIVYFNGEKVPAEVSLDGEQSFSSGAVYRHLRRGRKYTGTLSYNGNFRRFTFVCNWDGVKTKEYFLGPDSSFKKYVLPDGVALNMVRIPAGSFMMGTVPGRERGQKGMESPQHKVTINSDFWIGETEVTQEQYQSVMKSNPTWVKGRNYPVAGINWLDAKRFCQRLTRYCSKQLPEGYKFDLPTEAQWEYACRAATQTALNNGKALSALTERCYNLDDIAWYKFNSKNMMPVKKKSPNAWGIYDMHGNVAEWCLDYYGVYQEKESIDPEGASSGRYRVYRGGSWEHAPDDCRSASRFGGDPRVEQRQNIGFRVVIVPQ